MTPDNATSQDSAAFSAARSIVEALKYQKHEALLAGGCVRDRLLGKIPKDYDVATSATPYGVRKIFRRTKDVGAKFGVVLVMHHGQKIEVATFRSDGEYRDGRRPEEVTFSDAEHDAQRRDFTINGMFYDPTTDQLVDYVNGQADLSAKLIRCIGDPSKRFAEDHLRLMRAVRFATTLGFDIEASTQDAIRQHASQIATISPERIRAELALMLMSPMRARAWELLGESNLLNHLIKDFSWDMSGRERVSAMFRTYPEACSLPLGLATVLAPLGMPKANRTVRACRELRCSNEEIAVVGVLHGWGRRFDREEPFEMADIKMMLASGHFEDLCLLASAWMTATSKSTAAIDSVRQRAATVAAEDVAPPPLLDGAFLLDQNVPQGPIYRKVLDAVYRAQLNETVTSAEQAEAMAMALIRDELG